MDTETRDNGIILAGSLRDDVAKWQEVFEAHDHALRPYLPHAAPTIQSLLNAAAALATAKYQSERMIELFDIGAQVSAQNAGESILAVPEAMQAPESELDIENTAT